MDQRHGTRNRRLLLLLPGLTLLLLMVVLASCAGRGFYTTNVDEPKQSTEQQTPKKDGQQAAKEKRTRLWASAADKVKPLGKAPLDTDVLAGGPERKHRVLAPGDNYKLQQQFPNTLVLRGPLTSPKVALTFDDGPDSRFTPQVLDVLKKHGVKATFFLMGSRVKGHPAVARRIYEEGHSIGNHTYWHPKLYAVGTDRLRWEVAETSKEIAALTGEQTRFFRAPYGGLTEEIVRTMDELGHTVVGWSVDSLDWTQADAETVRQNVLGNVHPGAIILFHSGGDWTQDLSGMVKALDEIIPALQAQGLTPVTVEELIGGRQ